MGRRAVNETMAHALADERRSARPTLITRLGRNLIRFPTRLARDVRRWFDPHFRLEREADRVIRRWFSRRQRHELESIVGTSAHHECRLLAYLASIAPAGGVILEIGAWKGKSTSWLVEGSSQRRDALPVVSVDPHSLGSWEEFQATVRRFRLVERGLRIHRAGSHDVGSAWSEPISLLWIDGSHDYPDVSQDIADFTPFIVPGGWVVFDDAAGGLFPGVEAAIDEGMTAASGFQREATIRHLQVFRRASAVSARAA